MPLLNYYSQTKMAKGEKFGVKTAILHLAPFDLSGKNVCPKATKGPGGCVDPCLNTSGRGQMGSQASGADRPDLSVVPGRRDAAGAGGGRPLVRRRGVRGRGR